MLMAWRFDPALAESFSKAVHDNATNINRHTCTGVTKSVKWKYMIEMKALGPFYNILRGNCLYLQNLKRRLKLILGEQDERCLYLVFPNQTIVQW